MSENTVSALVQLSRDLGDPAADLAILGEGNTSADLGDGTYLVKASGTSLRHAEDSSFVRLNRAAVLAVVQDPDLDDFDGVELERRMRAAIIEPGGPKPSIEAMLHAITIELCGAAYTGHTHPTAITGILCSRNPQILIEGHLFPDQVIVCGRNPLLVPYLEPGLQLARGLRDALIQHIADHGAPPKLVHLTNHGIIAIGESATEVRQVTAMAVKAARVLQIACTTGLPTYLPMSSVERLDTRPDELYRRDILAGRNDEDQQ